MYPKAAWTRQSRQIGGAAALRASGICWWLSGGLRRACCCHFITDSRSAHRPVCAIQTGLPSPAGPCGARAPPLLPAGNLAPRHVALSELVASGSLRAAQVMGAPVSRPLLLGTDEGAHGSSSFQTGLLREGLRRKASCCVFSHPIPLAFGISLSGVTFFKRVASH